MTATNPLVTQDWKARVDSFTAEIVETLGEVRSCRICGCTDDDCSGCVERTGRPCRWVEADLCSACEIELRWSGHYRVIPERRAEPQLTDAQKQRSDELFYGHEFESSYFGR